jgi:molybdate transport system substrate-binding protein
MLRFLPAALAALAVAVVAAGGGALAPVRLKPDATTVDLSVRVAAASDVKFALDEIAARFGRETGVTVDLVYGSSGTLTHQLIEGAPYDVFLSADEGFVNQLADAGLTRDRGAPYAVGRLVIFAPRGSPLTPDPELGGLRTLLDEGRVTRFAIANPAHAPYGRAAEAALRTRGLWARIEPRLVLGENIAQAAQFATTGGAVGGILAYSLVLAPPLKDRGTFALIPASDHPPLRQRMVLLKRASAGARRFYEYLQQPEAREVLRRYGFAVPAARSPQPGRAMP